MDLKHLVAVSGLPGIFRMAANRANGMIIEDLTNGKKIFVPARKHQFTPLESTGIYIDNGDTTELEKVFQNMMDNAEKTPPINPNASPEELHRYFSVILPNYDRDRVHTGDIKKVIKWYNILGETGLLTQTPAQEESETEE
ncbi:MAG: DUF5606 domain-containing protein [Saprospiraceae bacterium]|nr:DUF5606 domain-containing protein [Saprospiraceae bacterium]